MKKLYISIIVALLLTTHLSALAQDNSQTDKEKEQGKVKRIFIRGNQRIDEKTIKTWINTRRGDDYNIAKLDRDIRALFDTGYFEDVKVFVEDAPREGKIITFDLRDCRVIWDVIYEYNNSADEARIAEELDWQNLKLTKGDMYNPVKVRKAARVMGEILTREWKREARVSPYIESMNATEVVVTFRVRE